MAFNLSSVSNECRMRAPRIVLLGVEKIGKSTFASQADRPIFLPIKSEEGIDSISIPQFPTCVEFANAISALYSLYSEQHDFGTVVIDSASALEPLIFADVCVTEKAPSIEKACGGYSKGYIEALSRWRQLTEALDALRNEKNMASIIIGHVKVKRFDDPNGESYDQYQFDIHEKAANLLYRWCDTILFCNTKVIVKKEDVGFKKEHKHGIDIAPGNRFLYTQKRPAHPGGGRGPYGMIPYELNLSWNDFMGAVSAVQK